MGGTFFLLAFPFSLFTLHWLPPVAEGTLVLALLQPLCSDPGWPPSQGRGVLRQQANPAEPEPRTSMSNEALLLFAFSFFKL